MTLLPNLKLRIDGLRQGGRGDDLTGARYRKQRLLSMVDYYIVSGFHLSAGFRSWKGKLPTNATTSGVGRLNMQSIAPLLPVKNSHSNLSPLATIGYQSRVSSNTTFGVEAGVINEHGKSFLANQFIAGEPRRSWSQTGAVAQASLKMRFF